MNCSTPGLPVHHQLPEFTQTHVHRVSDAIQPSHPRHPLLLLPPIPSSIRVFSNESTLRMRWPKYWSIVDLQQWFFLQIFSASPYFGVASIMIDHLILSHRSLKFCSVFKVFFSFFLCPTVAGFSCCVSSSVIFFSFLETSLLLASSLIPFGFIKNTFHFSSECSCFYGVSFYSCIS